MYGGMMEMITRIRQRHHPQPHHHEATQYSRVETAETTTQNAGATSPSCNDYQQEEILPAGSNASKSFLEIDNDHGDACPTTTMLTAPEGTESQISVALNLAKCICGAGSFALPHVFLKEGVWGGTIALTTCAVLASSTLQSLMTSKQLAAGIYAHPILSYVDLAECTLGSWAAMIVFVLTLSASLGVCSTYLVFIGQTMASLSKDATSHNIVRQFAADVPVRTWEVLALIALYPLSLIRDYSIFAFTSTVGVVAVVGGILVTLASGIYVQPGGGLQAAWDAIFINDSDNSNALPTYAVPMWPESMADAFGGSFGTIAYLFCVNFLTFPIMNSMKEPQHYGISVKAAIVGVWLVNLVFAILCLGFYGRDTQDLVLANLDNGPYLSALKLLLCIDLLFTFPIVFSSGRQILENAILGPPSSSDVVDSSQEVSSSILIARGVLAAAAITVCFGLAQIGGFGAVANLVGGVAQGTLAFIMPPAIAVSLKRNQRRHCNPQLGVSAGAADYFPLDGGEFRQFLLGVFGVVVVSSVTFFTGKELFEKRL